MGSQPPHHPPEPPSDSPDGVELDSLIPARWVLDLISEQNSQSHDLKKAELDQSHDLKRIELNHRITESNRKNTRFYSILASLTIIIVMAIIFCPDATRADLYQALATVIKTTIKAGIT